MLSSLAFHSYLLESCFSCLVDVLELENAMLVIVVRNREKLHSLVDHCVDNLLLFNCFEVLK